MSSEEYAAFVDAVENSAAIVRQRLGSLPTTGIILGTGLGGLAERIDIRETIPYADIPHFPEPTVESHGGRLIVGSLGGKDVVALHGRFHLYEGYTPNEVTLSVRVLALCGVQTLIISNASGGMNPDMRRSDLVLIEDHINFQAQNPLEGPNHDAWGIRFPDMSDPYDRSLRQLVRETATELDIDLKEGVYVAVVGPNLETRAEYRMLRGFGADVVGMSTVPEVLVARHMRVRVIAVSVVTDECDPDNLKPVSIEEVLEAASVAEPNLTRLIEGVVGRLD